MQLHDILDREELEFLCQFAPENMDLTAAELRPDTYPTQETDMPSETPSRAAVPLTPAELKKVDKLARGLNRSRAQVLSGLVRLGLQQGVEALEREIRGR